MTMSRQDGAAEPSPDEVAEAVPPRRMALTPGRPRRLSYELENTGATPAEVLLALPSDGPDQVLQSYEVTVTAAEDGVPPPPYEVLTEPESLAVTLPPGAGIRLRALVQPWTRALVDGPAEPAEPAESPAEAPHLSRALSPAQRQRYLRATPLTPLTPNLCAEAAAVVGYPTDVVVRARALFDHLTGGIFGYRESPPDHGAEALRTTRQGDAGDFACLFVAWCRSVDVPARCVVGAWPTFFEETHTWAEFHVDGTGWVPVDPAVAAALRGGDDVFQSYGVGADPEAQFGALVGERVVFTRDCAMALPRRFREVAGQLAADSGDGDSGDGDSGGPPTVAGRPFRRGLDSLDGTVPFLRPDFVLLHRADAKVPAPTWHISYAGWRVPVNAGYFTAFTAVVCFIGYFLIARVFGLEVPGGLAVVFPLVVAFALGTGLALRRSVATELKMLVGGLFGFIVGFAELLRDLPVIGTVVTFLFF